MGYLRCVCGWPGFAAAHFVSRRPGDSDFRSYVSAQPRAAFVAPILAKYELRGTKVSLVSTDGTSGRQLLGWRASSTGAVIVDRGTVGASRVCVIGMKCAPLASLYADIRHCSQRIQSRSE